MAYTPATASTFKLRYPAFADVPDASIEYWLTDASERVVLPDEWTDPNGPVAQMLVAAHNLALGGIGGSGGLDLPAGVTSMRSGGLSLSFDAGVAQAQAAGGWAATSYGAQYLALLKLTRGGSRVTDLGTACCDYGAVPLRYRVSGGWYGG